MPFSDGVFSPPPPVNEPVLHYAPGSPERASLQEEIARQCGEVIDIHSVIGGKLAESTDLADVTMPSDHGHVLARLHRAGGSEVEAAISASLDAAADWAAMDWQDRAAIFLRAAELLAGSWRDRINASTMLGQAKTCHQAEIDAACELIDFWRFNVHFTRGIYAQQPMSTSACWNRQDYRPLEGFVLAVTPFNFTSIAGNLPTAPALMGNTVVWKPATTQAYSAHFLMQLLIEAGLPPGVINIVHAPGSVVGASALTHRDLAGIHFTGSTGTFQHMWKTVGENIANYRTYPRIVGETGGKDFILAHPSADPRSLAVAIVRGGFEYQGQKCSAASRLYIPSNLWPEVSERVTGMLSEIKMGDVRDFSNFVSAVIDKSAFDNISSYQALAREDCEVLAGGHSDASKGWYVEPTLVQVSDPRHRLMQEEIFGPVVSAWVYPENEFEGAMDLVDNCSPYALTGAIFAQERTALVRASQRLRNSAGNFYLNDKPTGAVVGQQPFGGARASGTNDKAGSSLNLLRWTSPRSIKETFEPAVDWRYPFLE